MKILLGNIFIYVYIVGGGSYYVWFVSQSLKTFCNLRWKKEYTKTKIDHKQKHFRLGSIHFISKYHPINILHSICKTKNAKYKSRYEHKNGDISWVREREREYNTYAICINFDAIYHFHVVSATCMFMRIIVAFLRSHLHVIATKLGATATQFHATIKNNNTNNINSMRASERKKNNKRLSV